jgi:hypothetical protein
MEEVARHSTAHGFFGMNIKEERTTSEASTESSVNLLEMPRTSLLRNFFIASGNFI